MAKKPSQHVGIPRTLKMAKELGHKPVKVKFSKLPDTVRHGFAMMASHGARANSYCGTAPSSDPSFWLVCYKDESGQCQWYHVPRTKIDNHE